MIIPPQDAAAVLSNTGGQAARPYSVLFQVTDRCNYSCIHCLQDHTKKPELSLSEVKRILQELADMGVMMLTLMGGEFFMRPDADEILRTANALQFAIRLKTTGHHIHERRADLIAQMRPIQVHMSMYASKPHLHEQITDQAGSWRRTLDAAKRLIQRKVPIQLNCPVVQSTADDTADLSALAKQLGARISFDPKMMGMTSGDQKPVELRMDWDQLGNFYRQDTRGIQEALDQTYKNPEKNSPTSKPCRAGQAIAVTPQGKVWPCICLPVACGDLTKQSIKEIWSSSNDLKEIRNLRFADLSECNRCQVRRYCHRCHAMALLEQGDMRGPSLEACRHAVATRDALRERGVIASTETAMPPTWSRVQKNGQHHFLESKRKPKTLRIVD